MMKRFLIQILKKFIDRFSILAFLTRYLRDSRMLSKKPVQTPLGFKFIGNEGMQNGTFEPVETELALKLIQASDTLINIGANIGYYCCIGLQHEKHVVAFEPVPLNIQYLIRNIKANGWESRIDIFPLALSDSRGVVEIFGVGTGASLIKGWAGTSEKLSTLVPTSTLERMIGDRFPSQKLFFIVDIEGAEKMMLEGARSFITREPKPVWMIEISIGEHQPRGITINPDLRSTFDLFWDEGYEAWTADRECREVLPMEIDKIVESGIDTLGTHNFLFIERGQKAGLLG